jgi:hypothetical protein
MLEDESMLTGPLELFLNNVDLSTWDASTDAILSRLVCDCIRTKTYDEPENLESPQNTSIGPNANPSGISLY